MNKNIDDKVGSQNRLKRKKSNLWFLKLVLRITTFILGVRRIIDKLFGDE